MNFLAHAHLSGNNNPILIGNLIADSVKGKTFYSFPENIQQGIVLHRKIDAFTDSHPVVKKSKELIRTESGKFAGIVVDIYYDHFLAREWHLFSSEPLDLYTNNLYKKLGLYFQYLPAKVIKILPYMIAQNWLHSYANFNDLNRVFMDMHRRSGYRSNMPVAVHELKKNYFNLHEQFMEFYPQLVSFAASERENLLSINSNNQSSGS